MTERSLNPAATQPTLTPLDRHRLKAVPNEQALIQGAPTWTAPAAPAPSVPKLAEDAFISRTYDVRNPAAVGQGLDGAVRSFAAVASDVEGLSQSHLTVGSSLALTGKLVKDGSQVIVNSGRVMDGLRLAHVGLSRRSAGYVSALAGVGDGIHKAKTRLQPMLMQVERVGAIGSLGLAAISMPSLAVSSVKHDRDAYRTLRNAHATTADKITAVENASYTNAAFAYTTVAVPGAIKILASTGMAGSTITRLAVQAKGTRAYDVAERAARVVTPVADATLLVADGLHLYTTLQDANATKMQRARSGLNVTLDVLKLGLYVAPQTRGVRMAYTAAGITQLGFAVCGIIRPDKR